MRLTTLVPSFLTALAVATGSAAKTPPDTGVTLIHAGRLFDSPSGTFLPARDILVRGNYLDMGWPRGEAARHNLFAYSEAGLTPVQVLQAATVNAARLLGAAERIEVVKAD